MIESETSSVQRDPSFAVIEHCRAERSSRSVLDIPHHRMPARRRLHSDLMVAARLQRDFHERTAIGLAKPAIPQHRHTGVRLSRVDDFAPRLIGNLPQKIDPLPFFLAQVSFEQGPILLIDRSLFELAGDSPRSRT